MKEMHDPFTSLFPHLDLHGETRETAPFQINSFIKDNYLIGKKKVVIIHGRSSNVLKKITLEILKKNIYVKDYFIDFNNDGETIIELKSK